MPLTDEQYESIEALAKNEDAIGDLYKTYSDLVPDYEHFFARMIDEERGHAIWLRRLLSTIDNSEIAMDKSRFNLEVIKRSTQHINNLAEEAKAKGITVHEAASNSMNVENSLLEKKFFEIFEGDSDEFKRIMSNLSKACEDHRDHVRKFLEGLDG